ncbi:thioredoxin-like protein [Lobosporangium transversale]|uniref:Thioredoxin-like protein n=1 Tax=Lobosporangium transversale TaxID=64571 RepID=A0A1Y2GTD0_9FUNG|nr:thioredoxin-like protein [Lobosporangium transversale]ORZ20955.1 thioredoxin-like protein [Lobosporangium transversale]|eukprot:XP_021882864.1 thioredoxin-like protein [Lobosporangium transversale]
MMADSTSTSATTGASVNVNASEVSSSSSKIGTNTNDNRFVDDETLDHNEEKGSGKDLDEDELFEELENDDYNMTSFREQRIEELKQEVERRKLMMEYDHGSYKDITDEKEVMDISTKTKHCVIHFYHSDFRRCMIVDKHLETLAKKHIKTKFVKIKVENAPFLVEKLQVKVLPCIIAFTDGIAVDRLVGFDELGNTDNFSTSMLELRYKTAGVIEDDSKKDSKKMKKKSIFGRDYGSDEGTDDE